MYGVGQSVSTLVLGSTPTVSLIYLHLYCDLIQKLHLVRASANASPGRLGRLIAQTASALERPHCLENPTDLRARQQPAAAQQNKKNHCGDPESVQCKEHPGWGYGG